APEEGQGTGGIREKPLPIGFSGARSPSTPRQGAYLTKVGEVDEPHQTPGRAQRVVWLSALASSRPARGLAGAGTRCRRPRRGVAAWVCARKAPGVARVVPPTPAVGWRRWPPRGRCCGGSGP